MIELDTNSTLVSNVVTYYAKVGFDTAPAGVKPGMTASVNVVLDKRDDAITLPTSAVSTTGTTETVTVKPKSGSESYEDDHDRAARRQRGRDHERPRASATRS